MEEELPRNHEGYQRGLVAYFDILGFTKIAADANISKTAQLIDRELLSIPAKVREEIERRFGVQRPENISTHSIIFADSILVWHSIPEREQGEPYHWYYFFSICAALMQEMFKAGLPLRGAISEGDFFVKQHCFVGKPITDCHSFAEKAEWAGCAIVPSAQEKLKEMQRKPMFNWGTIMEQVCVEYAIPLKQENIVRGLVIKWFHLNRWTMSDDTDPRISESVKQAFTEHGKTVGEREVAKLQNTETFLSFVDGLYVNSNEKIPKSTLKRLSLKRQKAN